MKKWGKFWMTLLVFSINLISVGGSYAAEIPTASANIIKSGDIMPENTVVLANAVDAQFVQDFSVLLKHLRLEWFIVEEGHVPDAAQDKNIIIIGRPDSQYTGDILRNLLLEEATTQIQAGEAVVIEQENPWQAGQRVILCAGDSQLHMRDAAEQAARDLIANVPPASNWLRSRFEAPLDDDMRDYMDYLCFTWDDAELPVSDLTMDVDAKPRRRISLSQAEADVERLFYLFAHGYAGYAFFNHNGEFEAAQARIMTALSSQSHWTSKDLATLFREELNFITDCHLKIGDRQYAHHADFWHNTQLPLTLNEKGYQFTASGERYTVRTINGQAPEPYIFPSLDAEGRALYRLGTLAVDKPTPLDLVAINTDGDEHHVKIRLEHPDFMYYTDKVFQEQTLGGIPVLRIRGFSDHHADDIQRFVKTARAHRDDSVIIIDLRGNGGGNEKWPIQWIQGLTGQRAEAVFAFAELQSQTTMVGRANNFAYLYNLYPKTLSYKTWWESFTQTAQSYEDNAQAPTWKGPLYPTFRAIPNDTTLIIVMNEYIASAGEGMVMRASRAENVVLVGENTMGCLTFGNAGTFQLPHSNMLVHLPINFGVYMDMEFREGQGLTPDFWVPAADAVNYAVAAVRSGTITTAQPLPPNIVEQDFKPEPAWAKVYLRKLPELVFIICCVIGGTTWAYFMRHKAGIVTAIGAVWTIVGSDMLMRDKPLGRGFLLAGGICLVSGAITLWRKRKTAALTVTF